MPAKRLTEESVLRLPCQLTPYQVQDGGTDAVPGLSVLVNPSGVRSYRVSYRLKGGAKRHSLNLGRVGEITLEEARDKARDTLRDARKGTDPKAGLPKFTDSFKSCVERWAKEKREGDGSISADKTEQFVLNACKAWHDRPIGTIDENDIRTLLTTKRETAPYSAHRLFSHLRTVFRWCEDENIIATIPRLRRPVKRLKGRTRPWFEGTKADDAIRILWQFAEKEGGDHGKFLKLLIITGKRRTAVQTMLWEHIDDDWYWRPPAGSENKRNHAVPLPKLARQVLGDKQHEGRVLGLFGVDGLARRIRRDTSLHDFVPHGIRHVVETKMAELDVPPHVRDMLLDHAPSRGAGKGYDHFRYRKQMLEAFELWCDHIQRVVKPIPKWQRNLEARAARLKEDDLYQQR